MLGLGYADDLEDRFTNDLEDQSRLIYMRESLIDDLSCAQFSMVHC